MKTKLYLPSILFSILFVFSCGKKVDRPDCANINTIEISQNGPVYEGENLRLSVIPISSTTLSYRWSGPKNWSFETSDSAEGQRINRNNITRAEAGVYKLQIFDKSQGCVQFEGSTTVKVNIVEQAPCKITANTSTSDNKQIGKYTFKIVKFGLTGTTYSITAAEKANSDVLELLFRVDGALLPGVYKTKGATATVAGQVGLHLKIGLMDYVAADGQSVYVTKNGNQLEVSFCVVKFSNPLDILNPSVAISSKLTQP